MYMLQKFIYEISHGHTVIIAHVMKEFGGNLHYFISDSVNVDRSCLLLVVSKSYLSKESTAKAPYLALQ